MRYTELTPGERSAIQSAIVTEYNQSHNQPLPQELLDTDGDNLILAGILHACILMTAHNIENTTREYNEMLDYLQYNMHQKNVQKERYPVYTTNQTFGNPKRSRELLNLMFRKHNLDFNEVLWRESDVITRLLNEISAGGNKLCGLMSLGVRNVIDELSKESGPNPVQKICGEKVAIAKDLGLVKD